MSSRATRAIDVTALKTVLKQRSFVLFFAGQSVSKIGNGIYQVGLGWAVYQITGSTVAMGTVLAANSVAEVLLTIFGGSLADRLPRRAVIITADSTAALILWILAIVSSHRAPSYSLLLGTAIALGVVAAFYRPAYQAMNADLLAKGDLGAANSMLSLSNNVSRVAGPALGGLAYALSGLTLVFALDALSFTFAALSLVLAGGQRRQPVRSDSGLLSELVAGWRYTVRAPWLSMIIVISLVANCACLAPFFVLLPKLVALSRGSVSILGLLTSTQLLVTGGAALLLAALPAAAQPGRRMLWLACSIGAGVIVLGVVVGNVALLFLAVILIGCGMSFDVIENTLIQDRVPKELLSRVYSVNIVVSFSLLPLAYAAAGFLAQWAGVRPLLIGGGLLLTGACAAGALSGKLSQISGISENAPADGGLDGQPLSAG